MQKELEIELVEGTVLERPSGEVPLEIQDAAEGKVLMTVGLRTYRMADAATPALRALQADSPVPMSHLGDMIGTDAAQSLVTLLLRIGHLRIAA